ncbi:hypothetical protein D7V91_04005 [bacterium 1xD42-67]|nr:hypothetical protein D7V91_04005 [bacterium 1xD42-67]
MTEGGSLLTEQPAAGLRDQSLDSLRGLAALSIIFIHTVFWSGETYVPQAVRSLSLVLDVPFFFFLSGWGAGYVRSLKKSLMSLAGIYLKYLVFWCLYVALLFSLWAVRGWDSGMSLFNLLGNLWFRIGAGTALPVVMGSIWFLPVYFTVLPLGSLLLWLARRASKGDGRRLLVWTGAFLALVLAGLVYTWAGGRIPLLSQTTLFYLVFYLLGLLCWRTKIPCLSWTAGLIALDLGAMVLLARRLGSDIFQMQDLKFPPAPVYLLFSLMTVIGALWLRGRLTGLSPSSPLCRIGRAALLFYFCQGIGASLLQRLAPRIHLAWYCKLPLAYCINLSITLVFVCLLSGAYRLVFRTLPAAIRRRS